jgi:Ca-activated chloride channel family protein
MISKKSTNILIGLSTVGLFGIAIVRLSGDTVSAKFNHASDSVTNDVMFGDFGGSVDNQVYFGNPNSARPGISYGAAPVEKSVAQHIEYGTHPEVKTSVDSISTFSIDVDTASYAIARRALQNNMLPSPASVRVEEFVNAFEYRDSAPTEEALTAYLEAAPSPVSAEADTYILRVAVKAADIETVGRKPWNLTFLVDVSGSMGGDDRIGLLKAAMLESIAHMKPSDTVALVTYAGRTEVALAPTRVKNRSKILRAIDDLNTGGGTDMGTGLELAYGLAAESHTEGAVSRVVVMSDGDTNIGAMGQDALLNQIAEYAGKGIKMTTVGVGDRFNDADMEQLANRGDGSYVYLDGKAQVKKVFGDQLDTWMQDVASDVKIQVEFDPKAVATWRQIGYENRAMADSEFRNDAKDAGEMGVGHNVTALYEIKLTGEPSSTLATVRLRYRPENAKNHIERELYLGTEGVKRQLRDASDDLKFSVAVASFALMLKHSPEAENVTPELIEELVSAGHGDRAVEFASLVRRTKSLWAGRL